MKNLLVSLFLFVLSTACFSQYTKKVKTFPSIEKSIFDTINDYRVSKGLKRLTWCDSAYKGAYHHSYYLSDMKEIPNLHKELVDDESCEEVPNFFDRLRKFVYNVTSPYGVECVITANFDDWWFNNKNINMPALATSDIFGGWKGSPGHNEAMLDNRVNRGAIAIVRELDGTYCRVVLVFYQKKIECLTPRGK